MADQTKQPSVHSRAMLARAIMGMLVEIVKVPAGKELRVEWVQLDTDACTFGGSWTLEEPLPDLEVDDD